MLFTLCTIWSKPSMMPIHTSQGLYHLGEGQLNVFKCKDTFALVCIRKYIPVDLLCFSVGTTEEPSEVLSGTVFFKCCYGDLP